MKTTFKTLALLFSFLTLILSCSNSDSDSESSSTGVVGRWEMISYKISNFENTGTTVDDWSDLNSRPYFDFKSNGRFSDNLINGNVREMNYEIKDGKINLEKSIAFETHNSFSYSLSGNKLELKREDKHTLSNGSSFTEYTVIVLQK